jgi:plasmid stabilization system protein ParE
LSSFAIVIDQAARRAARKARESGRVGPLSMQLSSASVSPAQHEQDVDEYSGWFGGGAFASKSQQVPPTSWRVSAFDQRPIVQAIRRLADQAEVATKNRKPLREPLHQLRDATWEIRVGNHRVFYEIREEGTVRILRVIIKSGTTEGSL